MILDIVMLLLVTAVTVAGLQAVGLILVIAFLITPAAAARFWTHNLGTMMILAGVIGAVSGWVGASISGLFPRLPAGAIIVLVAAAIFLVSMLFGRARGVVARYMRHQGLKRRIGQQHLLRAAFEWLEAHGIQEDQQPPGEYNVPISDIVAMRSWNQTVVMKEIKRAYNRALIKHYDDEVLMLSLSGRKEAAKVTRNHRLWELYLIENADIAPSHVDRDADAVEHVIGEAIVKELETLLPKLESSRSQPVPTSPHH